MLKIWYRGRFIWYESSQKTSSTRFLTDNCQIEYGQLSVKTPTFSNSQNFGVFGEKSDKNRLS
jgi:hypothetical protein